MTRVPVTPRSPGFGRGKSSRAPRAMPAIFPCGCSAFKVGMGLCSIYDDEGNVRPEPGEITWRPGVRLPVLGREPTFNLEPQEFPLYARGHRPPTSDQVIEAIILSLAVIVVGWVAGQAVWLALPWLRSF